MAVTLPASWYRGTDSFERDRTTVFAREWLCVAHSSDLPDAGSYLALEVAGYPIVVVRDASGGLVGYHNVCVHRGGPLVHEGTGTARSFVCRYHGWAYGLDGALKSARDFGDSAELDLERCSLWPVQVERWRSLVFVCLDRAAPPLAESLGEFADACADLPLEQFQPAGERSHELACDWKTYADNYLEGYHIPLVHPGLNREVDTAHYEVLVGDRWCEHVAPTRDGAVNAGRWLWRYPNLALNCYPESMNLERYWPIGVGRTAVTYRYFTLDGTLDPQVEAMSTTVLEEDRVICEAVQRRLDAGVYDTGVLSPRHEAGVAAFQWWVREDASR